MNSVRLLFAIMTNELRLLFRDRAGLLLLFLMPAMLVAIITLVQENVMKTTGQSGMQTLFVNRDGGDIGRIIEERLQASEHLRLVVGPRDTTDEQALKKLADGEFQVCLIVPEGFTENLQTLLSRQVQEAFGNRTREASEPETREVPELAVWFDPLLQGSFRVSVTNALHLMMLAIEMDAKARAFSKAVPIYAGNMARKFSGTELPPTLFSPIGDEWGRESLIALRSGQSGRGDFDKLPSSIQQNVPAWSLFGMFFIVVPMSGVLIRERREGVLKRLTTLPVSYSLLLLGKALAYVLICLVQFALILAIGKWILPVLGTEVLEIGTAWEAILAVVLSASLAAAGYGIMVGNLARTYEQASMFGAVSVVIAAVLGGVMVPSFVMPEIMRDISRFSPLAWGLNALTGIFVKGEGLRDVLPEIVWLLCFSCSAILIGWRGFVHRRNRI